MLEYFDKDLDRHEELRREIRQEFKTTDLEFIHNKKEVYKAIARAAKAVEKGQVFLSPAVKSLFDTLLKEGYKCYLVIDTINNVRQYKQGQDWRFYPYDTFTGKTDRYVILETLL